MAYTAFNSGVPIGTQNGTAALDSMRLNGTALRDAILMGSMQGFIYSQSGGASVEEPGVQLWVNGATCLRATNTWSTGTYVNQSQIVWALALNWNGLTGTFDTICTETRTYDTDGNLTATSSGGGMAAWLAGVVGKFKALRTAFNAHAAATTGVHGLGTMATQAANNINITGGNIDGTVIGSGTPATATFLRAVETWHEYSSLTPGATVTIDLTYGGSSVHYPGSGITTLTFINAPIYGRIGTHAIYCTNFANTAFPASVSWGVSGKPGVTGAVLANLVTLDGGSSYIGIVAWRVS